MKRSITYILILVFLYAIQGNAQIDRSQKPAPGPAPVIEIGEYETFKLKNGLTVIVVENHKMPRVSFSLIIDRDPVLEKNKVGYVSMAGQMLRRGTENRTKDQIDEEVDFMGASLFAGSNSVYASSLTKHRDKLLDLMTDILYNPVFPEEELDKVKKQTLSAIASQKEDPEAIADNVTRVVLYSKDHPYGEVQREDHVDRIDRQDLVDYYDTYFKPNIAYLAIVGDINVKEAKKIAKKYFGTWEAGEVPENTYEVPSAPAGNTVALADRSNSVQTVLTLSYPIVLEKGHPNVVKANVMNQILGGSSSSRLFKNIREEKGYTYGAYSSISSDELVGNFNAGASVRNEVTDSALIEFINEFEKMHTEKVREDELQIAKNVLIGSFGRSLESPQTLASYAISIERYGLPEDYYDTYVQRVEAVTAGDVMEMAEKYILPDNLHIIAVGKKTDIEDKLKKFGEINYYGPYGSELDPSKAALPPGMDAGKVFANHIEAIGGREKLSTVNDISYQMSAEVMNNTIDMQILKKRPNKMRVEVKMGSNVMSQQIYDGENARLMQMGNQMPVNEDMLARMEVEGHLFPEMIYMQQENVKAELTGIESIEGKDAYAVNITYPSGESTTHYYDTDTYFKIRQTQTAHTPQGEIIMSTGYGHFQEVDGVILPYLFKIPMSPKMQMNAEVKSIEINKGLDDDLFSVD